jgi:translation initiation factor IF-3
MSKFKKREERQPINDDIMYNELRVIDESGQLGVMSKNKALHIAQEQGLDLVVITESSIPPVAKILDASKHFYEIKRREKEVAKKQRESRVEVKEIQFRPGIGDHDFETKLKHIDNFLTKGAKVRCMVRYRGRENANKQLGFEILQRVYNTLENIEWEQQPNLNGNRLIGVLKRGKNG